MEKVIVKIHDSYDGETRYVKLDENQVNLLHWLSNCGFLRDQIDYEPSGIPEIEEV